MHILFIWQKLQFYCYISVAKRKQTRGRRAGKEELTIVILSFFLNLNLTNQQTKKEWICELRRFETKIKQTV